MAVQPILDNEAGRVVPAMLFGDAEIMFALIGPCIWLSGTHERAL